MTSTDEIRFAEWQIWPQLRILLHRGKPVKISGRAFDVLVVLVSAKGQVVSKDSLLAQVWGNEIVEENNLRAQISAIRRVLGHDRHLLVTEFGSGYRFNCTSKPPMMSSEPTRLAPVTFPFLTSILGRDQAVLDICALIRQHPLVTITGLVEWVRLVSHGKSLTFFRRNIQMAFAWLNWRTSLMSPAFSLFSRRHCICH